LGGFGAVVGTEVDDIVAAFVQFTALSLFEDSRISEGNLGRLVGISAKMSLATANFDSVAVHSHCV